jgi:stage III sporulation protein AA
MGPGCIALDEITEEEDCRALIQAANCGVTLLATAHAGSREEFLSRPVYIPLAEKGIFEYLVILHRDRTYRVERMAP